MRALPLAVLCLVSSSSSSTAAPIASTMLAAKKTGLFGCQTPFHCIKVESVPVPEPAEGQVLLAVKGSSVNPCDVDYIEFGVGCSGGGGVLGMDVAGTVVKVGPGCTRLKVGDEVWADTGGVKGDTGGMAEFAVTNEKQTGIKPANLSFAEAGTIPLVGFTALECLQKTGAGGAPWAKENLTVVVTSGSGGTGFVGVQLAKAYGAAHVATATSGAANIAFVTSLGADIVVDYKQQDIFDALPADSVDIVFDNYGAKGSADKAMRAIKSGGTYLLLPGGEGGALSKHPKAGVKQINFGFTTSSSHEPLDTLASFFNAGKLRAHVFAQFGLANASAAFALSKTGTVVGKVSVAP